MIDLVHHILSGEDYITSVAQLDKVSDAKKLLDFLLTMLEFGVPFSNQNSSMAGDMVQRGRQFMLEVFSKMHIVPSLNVPYDLDSYALPLLLYILKHSKCIKVHHFRPALNVPHLQTNSISIHLLWTQQLLTLYTRFYSARTTSTSQLR